MVSAFSVDRQWAIASDDAVELCVDVVNDAAGLNALSEEWTALLASSRSDCLFLTWEWVHTWWTQFGQGRKLFVVCVRAGSQLVGLAPLTVNRAWAGPLAIQTLEFAGSGSVGSDYLDFIVDSKWETAAVAALTAFLVETGMTLRFARVREDSLVATSIRRGFLERGWHCRNVSMEVCPYIDQAGSSWDTYLARLRRKHRSNFTRSLRNLEKDYSVRFECAATDQERRDALSHVVNLHLQRRSSLGGSNAFHDRRLVAFHEALSAVALDRGWLRLFVLTLNGKAAAALYCFHYGSTFLYYQIGFDPAFQRHAVGKIAVGLSIQRAFEEGAATYDFLHGDEPYKFDWTTQVQRLLRMELYPAGRIGQMQYRGACATAALKTVAKRALRRAQPAMTVPND